MKEKAFTLVELLGVIVLLGILGVVIIPKVGDSITNSKETSLITQEEQIKKAANDFIIENVELFNNTDTITIKLGVLKQKGYLPVNIKNPKTRKDISNESTITITKIGNRFETILNLIDLENVTENIQNNSPILVLNGNYVEYIDVNSTYEEKGATAKTSTGETLDDISIQIKLNDEEKTSIDTSQLLTYNIIYSVTDTNGLTTSATRTVIIKDSISPTITFPKETTLLADQVNGYNLREGILISDNYDLNPTLTINSELSNRPGKYVTTYTATDSSGNTTIERRVIIVENTPTYIIKGKTTPSSEDTPTMENPVTYYGFGRDNYIDVIETHGKNLFDKSKYLNLEDYSKHNNTSKYDYTEIPLKANTTYKISVIRYNEFDGENNGHLLISNHNSINYNYTSIAHRTYPNFSQTNFTYTTGDNGLLYIGLVYTTQENLDTIWANTDVQLEEGTQSTEFEPYQGSTTRINLTGHDPLMCLGDNCDYIDYEKNRIVRNVGKYIVTGNESWTLRSEYTQNGKYVYSLTTSIPFTYKIYGNTKALNNYIEYGGTVTGVASFSEINSNFSLYYNPSIPTSKAIYIKSSISTQANFKSNLQSLNSSGNPMIIYYELAEPQFESIDLPQVNLRWNSDTFVTDGYVTKTYN